MTSDDLNAFYQLGGVLAVVAGGGLVGLRWVVATLKKLPSMPTETRREATTIVTADTVAMDRLAGSVEALNLTVTDLKSMLKAEIDARNFEERVDEEAERRAQERAEQIVAERLEQERRRTPRKTDT